MRRVVLGLAVLLVASGCQRSLGAGPEAQDPDPLHIVESPSPYTEVTAGPVRAMIPDDWQPVATAPGSGGGFFASPEPNAWRRMDGSVAGMVATWVDETQVGVPSDYYYLAASGPVLGRLTSAPGCVGHQVVLIDNQPGWMAGAADSPGDFLARGRGTCTRHGVPTRWAYFVAAPGFGAARTVGIPAAGLYIVVAVLPDSRNAPKLLHILLHGTTFGTAGIRDLVAAARGTP
ncbi:MAG: hypothetical protein HY240_02490 [Actinobacteria bacterium]|nr:hypothetical protein [Actinomycetota bacterium]